VLRRIESIFRQGKEEGEECRRILLNRLLLFVKSKARRKEDDEGYAGLWKAAQQVACDLQAVREELVPFAESSLRELLLSESFDAAIPLEQEGDA